MPWRCRSVASRLSSLVHSSVRASFRPSRLSSRQPSAHTSAPAPVAAFASVARRPHRVGLFFARRPAWSLVFGLLVGFRFMGNMASEQKNAKMVVPSKHHVLKTPLDDEFKGKEFAMFGMGCFWGAEKKFWKAPGVHSTAVGYAGGVTEHPSYEQVCEHNTGHAEVVRVVYDPTLTTYQDLLNVFWGNHDPTQLNRQGNDVGDSYRSVIFYYNDDQKKLAESTRDAFQVSLTENGYGPIVTQILPAPVFYFAEGYHQQYLSKNPNGYCGLGGTGCYDPAEVNKLLKL